MSSGFGRVSSVLQSTGRDLALFGTAGQRDIKRVAESVSGLAMSFGPGGMLVSAVGFGLTAILTMGSRARDEMEKTKAHAMATLRDIRSAADPGRTSKIAGQLFEGVRTEDVDVAQFAKAHRITEEAAKLGVRGLETQIAQLTETYTRGISASGQMTETAIKANAEILRLQPLLDGIKTRWMEIGTEADRQALAAAQRDKIGNKIKAEEEALEEAKRAAEEYSKEILKDLSAAAPPGSLVSLWSQTKHAPITVDIKVAPVVETTVDESLAAWAKNYGKQAEMALKQAFMEMPIDLATAGAQAFGAGLAGGFDDAGEMILSALGGIMANIGQMMIATGVGLMQLTPALSNFLTAGPALVAAGLLLTALGTAASKIATGRGGGGGYGAYGGGPIGRQPMEERFTLGSPAQSTTTGMASQAANLQPRQIYNIQIFGDPHDLRVQRWMNDTLEAGAPRGLQPWSGRYGASGRG